MTTSKAPFAPLHNELRGVQTDRKLFREMQVFAAVNTDRKIFEFLFIHESFLPSTTQEKSTHYSKRWLLKRIRPDKLGP